MIDALWLDLRHSVRRLRRAPGLSLTVIGTLALVFAANTTVFSLLNAVTLRKVAAPDPERLVAISATDLRTNSPGPVYLATLTAFRDQQRSFSALAMYSVRFLRGEARGAGFDVNAEGVTPDYFTVVDTRPIAGRFFTDRDGDPAVAVISHRFWQQRFGGDPRAIGETMTLDAKPVTIIGVAEAWFGGMQSDGGSDVFMPLAFVRTLAGERPGAFRAQNAVGRLAPGATLSEARAEVLARWPAIQAATASTLPPADQSGAASLRVAVETAATGFSTLRREYGPSLLVLMGLSAVLLAIGCVNLSGMMLSRAAARQHEIAVLLALGAGRARVFQQSIIDGVLLATCGVAIALPLAWVASEWVTALMTIARATALARPLTPDLKVFAIALVAALVMGTLIGVLPAWRAVNRVAPDALRQGRTVAKTLGRSGRVVLVTQIALSMVLLVGAGLFARMLWNLHANEAPFRGRDIVWTRLARTPGDRTTLDETYFRRLIDELSAIPGVESAALSLNFPAFLGFRGALPVARFTAGDAGNAVPVTGMTEYVTPGFFSIFGIARISGRDFTWSDDARTPPVAIVSRTLATRLFPGGNVIGRRLRVTAGATTSEAEIVGIVDDAPIGNIREPHLAVAFRPMMQDLVRAQFPNAHIRTVGDANVARAGYLRVIESQRGHFVRILFTLDQWIDFALLQERLIATVSTLAAALAMLLACIGLYGVMAFSVTARAREIGVRMALGATRPSVLKMIARDGITVAATGVAIGIPCALGAATLVRSELYGVTATDPRTVMSAAGLFIAVALAAALVPALRASKIDPVEALRHE